MTPGLFITGTDTDVGKTYIAAMVIHALRAEGLRVGVYKPVASGCVEQDGKQVCQDALALSTAAGYPDQIDRVCPQQYAAPLAPHLAARAEGKQVDRKLLREGIKTWQACSDVVIVEGAGGLMSPLSDEDYNADLAAEFGYPLLVVSPNVLGTINQTLQTLFVARNYGKGLEIAGVVLNDARPLGGQSQQSNRGELELRCEAPVLAAVGWRDESFSEPISWAALIGGSR